MPTIAEAPLRAFAESLLVAGGLDRDEASIVADSLVSANLHGHDSHGVMRIPYYLDQATKGELRPGIKPVVLKDTATLVALDGQWGFGQPLARQLTESAMAKARESGLCMGTLIHSGHVGRLGEYCEQAGAAGLVSMMMVNTHGAARRVAPPGGKAPRLGTNPIAFGIPAKPTPIVLDFGTSATAEGKVRVKRIAGQACPPDWLLDSEGRPTTDPATLYGDPPGTILPMGGPQAYKGFGLALVIEVLAGALTGGITIREVPVNPIGNCVFLLVVDPAHTTTANHFSAEVRQLVEFVRSCPRIAGVDEIMLPGDPEQKSLAARRKSGIPLDEGNWQALVALAKKLAVPVPVRAG